MVRILFTVLFGLFLWSETGWANLIAWVERNPVIVGESFVFHIELEGDSNSVEPDLSNLRGLQVLNRSVQNQTSFVGTRMSRKVSWAFELLAFEEGTLVIPPIQVGQNITEPNKTEQSRTEPSRTEYDRTVEHNIADRIGQNRTEQQEARAGPE